MRTYKTTCDICKKEYDPNYGTTGSLKLNQTETDSCPEHSHYVLNDICGACAGRLKRAIKKEFEPEGLTVNMEHGAFPNPK